MAQIKVNELALVNLDGVRNADVWEACGWWDWFCSETALRNRSKPMISLAKRIYHKWGETGMFLKNNCPMHGPTYDAFVLQTEAGDNHYFISKGDKSEDTTWTVYDVTSEILGIPVFGCVNVSQLATWLNDQK